MRALVLAALAAMAIASVARADIYMSTPRGAFDRDRDVRKDATATHPTDSSSPVFTLDANGRCHGPGGQPEPAVKCRKPAGRR